MPGTGRAGSTRPTSGDGVPCDPAPLSDLITVYAAFDGGARVSSDRSACAWCVWSPTHDLLQWQVVSFATGRTNNEMEAQGLLHCLRWLRRHHLRARVIVFGDSAVIIAMALMSNRCLAHNLRPWIAAIRAHGTRSPAVYLQHVRRVFNTAADALCNWAMDQVPTQPLQVFRGIAWPCPPGYGASAGPHELAPTAALAAQSPHDREAWWRATWSLVMTVLVYVSPLIAPRFDPVISAGPIHAPGQAPPPRASVVTRARALKSDFDYTPVRSCIVDGIPRCVPLDVYVALQRAARHCGVPFPRRSAFLAPGAGPLVIPYADVRILDALVASPSYGIAGTLALFRGQTAEDQRPNKALRPSLYRKHLSAYPQLELMCAIADTGMVPAWRSPDGCAGARPVPANYPGADTGSSVVINKLLVDYYRGRCIIATMATLVAEPGFHSSAFALVPKKDIPLHIDGRIIHDLKQPLGTSVNDQTDTSQSPDATWDPYVSIAQRVRDLRRRYPGYTIYAMGADIADAFHHVPMHARHASAFGGQLPRSSIGIISGMAVFGWTASPGNFAVFGRAVSHYQRTGASTILGFQEPFWIFQWVDDIVLIEVDIGDRLEQAEKRLRDGIKLVFGSDGWHEGKFTTWSRDFHAVGIDWSIPHETISVPQRKIDKVKNMIDETLQKRFVSTKQLDSVIGVLRHVISFIPITKPFIQRLTAMQHNCVRRLAPGVPMSEFLRKDLEWWKDLVFENEFAGMPMRLFEPNPAADECWTIHEADDQVIITSMRLRRRAVLDRGNQPVSDTVAYALAQTTATWGPTLALTDAWRHVIIYCWSRQIEALVSKMKSSTTSGQADLRQCALSQAQYRLHFEIQRSKRSMERTAQCDVHTGTNYIDVLQTPGSRVSRIKPNSSNELQWPGPHLGCTGGTSSSGKRSATTLDSPCGSTSCPGHNKQEWSDYSPDCAPQKDTTRTSKATSTRRLTVKWQQSPSPTRRHGTPGSITMIQSLSSLLKDISAPTVKWTGNSQLLHRCCARCARV